MTDVGAPSEDRAVAATPGGPTPSGPDDADHLAALARARRFALVVTLVWTCAVGLDALAATHLAPGSLGVLLLLRLVGTVLILGAWITLRITHVSPAGLRLLLVGSFLGASVVLSVMGAVAGGLTSPYFGGAIVGLAAYGLLIHARWRRGAVDAAGVAVAFPATMLVASLFSPRVAAQLHDPEALAVFQFDLTNLLVMYVVVVLAGHVAWSLRRQVFEARSVGRYKLKRRLGAGGMGEVWVAYHHGLKRDVAVKILRSDGGLTGPGAVARFEREVQATAELTHPNTIRVFDYGVTDDGLCYYVMELLDGENLAAIVARQGAQPPPRAIYLVMQAARALAEAHARGIVHRDVKPENLVVATVGGEPDFVKVLDFGIAKLAADREDVALTRTGLVLGTPQWLAPEAFAGQRVGPQADVYALGAVLYLILAGRPPFEGSTLVALAEAHVHREPPPLPGSVPQDLAAVVGVCLRKNPAERFATARDLVEALAACSDAGRWSMLPAQPLTAGERVSKVDAMGATKPLDTRERR
jgi:serine/threonine-protein kinase